MPGQWLRDLRLETQVVLYGKYVQGELEVAEGPPPADQSIITFPATVLYRSGSLDVLVGWKDGERSAGSAFKIEDKMTALVNSGSAGGSSLYHGLKTVFVAGFRQAVWAVSMTTIHSLAGEVVPRRQPQRADVPTSDSTPQPVIPVQPVMPSVVCKRAYYGIDCDCGKCPSKKRSYA